jgi:hypothetical protein
MSVRTAVHLCKQLLTRLLQPEDCSLNCTFQCVGSEGNVYLSQNTEKGNILPESVVIDVLHAISGTLTGQMQKATW